MTYIPEMCDVLSFDPNKTKLIKRGGSFLAVEKEAKLKELYQILLAKNYLKEHPIFVGGSISVQVVPILSVSGKLITRFCCGKNIERVLRFSLGQERTWWIGILRELMLKFRKNGFLWGDFAPRNMVFDPIQKKIFLMDFERDSFFLGHKCPADFFSIYIRQYSQEEFCCCLFPGEMRFFFEGVMLKENRVLVPTDRINSRRRRFLLKTFFGESVEYGGFEVGEIEQTMASLAMPFFINGRIFNPMFKIEEAIKRGGYNVYRKLFEEYLQRGRNYSWCQFIKSIV